MSLPSEEPARQTTGRHNNCRPLEMECCYGRVYRKDFQSVRFNKLLCPINYNYILKKEKASLHSSSCNRSRGLPLRSFICSLMHHTLASRPSRPTLCQTLRVHWWMRSTWISPHGVHICADESTVRQLMSQPWIWVKTSCEEGVFQEDLGNPKEWRKTS